MQRHNFQHKEIRMRGLSMDDMEMAFIEFKNPEGNAG